MKSRMVFPIVITLIVSLACQFSGQQPADPNEVPTQTQETIIPTETPVLPVELESEITDEFGAPMALVPEGEFLMGADAEEALAECMKSMDDCQLEWFTDAEPPHQVYLDAFYMDIYEVTNAHYAVCVEAGECFPPRRPASITRSSYYGDPQYDNYPVVLVSWDLARAYCKWRGGDLPTEAQWEKAARGTEGGTYPWGEGIDPDRANYNENVGDTTEVGSYENGKSPYGMYDMAGNVWEWVIDRYDPDYYARSPSSNPPGSTAGELRVLRGSSFNFLGDFVLRVSIRRGLAPDSFNYAIGFRCAKDVGP